MKSYPKIHQKIICYIRLIFLNHKISRKIFINPSTNRTWEEGDVYKRENLANTLEKIGKNGLQEFYSGDTAKILIDELRNQSSILTLEDLRNYRYLFSSYNDNTLEMDLQ